jgi:hypothetical protein
LNGDALGQLPPFIGGGKPAAASILAGGGHFTPMLLPFLT